MKDIKLKDREIAGRLKAKLTEKRIKIGPLAEVLGVAPTTIYTKMSGGSGVTLSELFLIASACYFTHEDIIYIIYG